LIRRYSHSCSRWSCFIYVICSYLRILVSNRTSVLDDVSVIQQLHDECHLWSRNCYPSGEPEFTIGCIGVCVAQSCVPCVMFCGSLFVFLYLFIWPLYCLSFN